MDTFKRIYNQNKLMIISTAALLLCSVTFSNILMHLRYYGAIELSFFSDGILEIVMLVFGIIFGFRYGDRLSKKYIPYFCAGSVVLRLCCSYSGFIDFFDFSIYFAPLCAFLTVYFLARYYIDYCTQSLLHSLLYVLSGVAFIIKTAGHIEVFFICTLQIILFLCLRGSIKDKRIKIVNIFYTVMAIFFDCFLIISNISKYDTLKYEEGHTADRIKIVMKSLKPFGESELYGEIEKLSSDFDIIRISACFGYVAGIFVLVVLTVFVACIFIKAFRNKNRVCAASLAAVSIFGVSYISSLFINYGVVFGNISVSIPIISEGKYNLFITGVLLGLFFLEGNAEKIKNEELCDGK